MMMYLKKQNPLPNLPLVIYNYILPGGCQSLKKYIPWIQTVPTIPYPYSVLLYPPPGQYNHGSDWPTQTQPKKDPRLLQSTRLSNHKLHFPSPIFLFFFFFPVFNLLFYYISFLIFSFLSFPMWGCASANDQRVARGFSLICLGLVLSGRR